MLLINLFSIGISIIGLVLLVVGIYWLIKNQQFRSRSVLYIATVVGNKKDRSINGDYLYYPTVTFATKNGDQKELKYPKGSLEIEIEEGEKLEVLYDESKDLLTVNSNFWLLFMPCFLIFLGLASIALGMLI